jgi:hypothetical protein
MERHISRGIAIALSDPNADIEKSKHVAFLFPRGQKKTPINVGVNSQSKGMNADNFTSSHAEINATFTGPHRHTYVGRHKKSKVKTSAVARQWVQRTSLPTVKEKQYWEKVSFAI